MELRHIRYFVRAAELLHFTHAAESLYISQPALSSHIQQLEAELDVALFDRVGRNVRLTDAGHRFLVHSQKILREVEFACQEVAELKGLKVGHIYLGALLSFGQEMLPDWVCSFHEKYPQIAISVCTGTSDFLEEKLAEGDIELALSFVPPENPELIFEKLFTQEACFVVSTTHPYSTRETISLAELAEVPLALVTKRWAARRMYDSLFTKHNFEPNVLIEIDDLRALISLVKTGSLGTILGKVSAGQSPDLHFVHIEDQPLIVDYGVIWNKQSNMSLAASAFLEHLQNWSSEIPSY